MIRAKKSLGQNFLIDDKVLNQIVNFVTIENKTILEISKNLDDPTKIEDLLEILEERKKEPIDYRRGGVITIFVGIGVCLLGYTAMGPFFVGAGYLVGAIGIGTMVAGYLYPSTGEELTNAVEGYEKK